MRAGARVHPAMMPWIVLGNFVRKIYLQRDLIRNFVVRDLRARYIGSFMGFFWSVINPIVLLTSYAFVFMVILQQKAPVDSGTKSFPLFLFCGILPWLFFQDTLQRSSTILLDNASLVTKTIFPTEILPLSVLLAGVVNHLIGFAILLGILLFTGNSFSPLIFMVPVYFFVLMLFTLGLAWMLASLNVFVRDIAQVLNVLLTFWFWFTPIFYTSSQFPKRLLFLVKLNPLAHIVIAYRDCMLQVRMPDLINLAVLALVSTAVFAAGGMFFRHVKREFVDVL